MKLDEPTKDRLRELGADEEMLRWLEHPEAVRDLIAPTPMGYECCARHGVSHEMSCKIAAAWRTLGDPRGQEDIMNAWDEAMQMVGPARVRRMNHVKVTPLVTESEPASRVSQIDRETGTITFDDGPIIEARPRRRRK